MPGSDTCAGEVHECLCPSLLYWISARFAVVVESDNERELLAFLRAAVIGLEGVEVIEHASPEGDHAANGLAEVGVREVKAQTRVLKSHLEERPKRQLDWSEPLATWLVRHAVNCLSRDRNQNDGKTPDQRRTGKRWRRQVVDFERKSSISTGRGMARRTRSRRCGENDGWHFRCSS